MDKKSIINILELYLENYRDELTRTRKEITNNGGVIDAYNQGKINILEYVISKTKLLIDGAKDETI